MQMDRVFCFLAEVTAVARSTDLLIQHAIASRPLELKAAANRPQACSAPSRGYANEFSIRIITAPLARPRMANTIQEELQGIAAFLAVIWGVFLLDAILPFDLAAWGVVPRTTSGLIGIPAMPFLHANWQHIVSNTVPLFILLVLLAGSKANSWEVVATIVLASGGLLWLIGRPAVHVGASGLIFGLIGFLIVSGLLERRFIPLAISVGVIFFYGGSLLWGIVPLGDRHVSWEGHLSGAIAGGVIAYWLTWGQAENASI